MFSVRASVPGKLILIGEHAAPFGCPAIVTALDLRCVVTVTALAKAEVCLSGQRYTFHELIAYAQKAGELWRDYNRRPSLHNFGFLRVSDPEHLLKCAIGETLGSLSCPLMGFELQICSDIPVNAGFGSSAALAVSVVAALMAFHDVTLDAQTILYLAGECEKRQHGDPSGIDHHTVFYGGTLIARKTENGTLHMMPLDASLNNFKVYHSGQAAESTGETVAAVRAKMQNFKLSPLNAMQCYVEDMAQLLLQPGSDIQAMQCCIQGYQAELEKLGVVPLKVRDVIRSIEKAGGAAKISGAGALTGEGAGCVITLCPDICGTHAAWPRINAAMGATGLKIDYVRN